MKTSILQVTETLDAMVSCLSRTREDCSLVPSPTPSACRTASDEKLGMRWDWVRG